MTTKPIAITSELLDRFSQFAAEHEVAVADLLTALASESEHQRSEAATVVDRLGSNGQTVRLAALADQLGAPLASILPGAQAAQATWQQLVSEIDQVSAGHGDAAWAQSQGRYTDGVTEQAFTVASTIAN